MLTTPHISVIIPVYNQEAYLSDCLDSVIKQSLHAIQIIAINDGSTDSSYEILSEYALNDKRILLINQENQGVAYARNTGIMAAEGEFIAFMDPDDWYPDQDILEVMYQTAVTHHVEIAGGSLARWENGEITYEHDRWDNINADYTFHEDKRIKYADYQFDYGYWRFIYKRSLLLENSLLFPEYVRFQDPPFFCRAMICAKEFYALKKTTYMYRETVKTPVWTSGKVSDMICGITDVLTLSRKHSLAKLHFIAFYRLNREYACNAVRSVLQHGNRNLLVLLAHANNAIDTDLLWSAHSQIDDKSWRVVEAYDKSDPVLIKSFILPHYDSQIKQLVTQANEYESQIKVYESQVKMYESLLQQLEMQLQQLKNGYSYRIGRIITWLPRKVQQRRRLFK